MKKENTKKTKAETKKTKQLKKETIKKQETGNRKTEKAITINLAPPIGTIKSLFNKTGIAKELCFKPDDLKTLWDNYPINFYSNLKGTRTGLPERRHTDIYFQKKGITPKNNTQLALDLITKAEKNKKGISLLLTEDGGQKRLLSGSGKCISFVIRDMGQTGEIVNLLG